MEELKRLVTNLSSVALCDFTSISCSSPCTPARCSSGGCTVYHIKSSILLSQPKLEFNAVDYEK
jgi:hypothetical protein